VIDAKTWRRFGAAAGVSGIAHALIVAFGTLELPLPPQERMPLAVRILEPVPAVTKPVHRAAVRRVARAGVRVRSAAVVPSPIPAVVQNDEIANEDAQPAALAEAPAPEPQVVAVAETAAPAAPEIDPEPAPLRSLPRKGRITYDLVYGPDRFPVGRTVQTWEADNGRYQLASRSETTGIVDFFRSQQRSYSSSGVLTREGLRPESFTAGRNRGRGRGLEEARAQFDWSQSLVTLGRATEQHQVKLPPHSQDLLSFVFQLAIDPPPPGRLSKVVVNGSKIQVYELDVLREESIDTPLGVLRTLPIKQVRKGNEESIELWLALEYRYLPVKLRFFDRQGEPQGEQIVADIRLAEN
jgi:hypothetical protein